MLKGLCFFLFLNFILLQACSKNTIQSESIVPSQQNKAATYNTQLGLLYLKQGDKQRAKHKILTALQLAPKLAEANLAFAYLLEKNGEMNKATLYYKKALSLAPKNGVMLNNYGAFLCRQGAYKKAELYFLKAVDDINYLETAAAFENAALCLAAIPDNEKAKFYFRQALKEDPKRKQAFYELVDLELKDGNYKSAFATVQKYLKSSDNDVQALKLALIAAKKAGKIKAQNEYEKRLKLTEHSGAENESSHRNG